MMCPEKCSLAGGRGAAAGYKEGGAMRRVSPVLALKSFFFNFFSFLFFLSFFYLFIFGCIGSSLLRVGFL